MYGYYCPLCGHILLTATALLVPIHYTALPEEPAHEMKLSQWYPVDKPLAEQEQDLRNLAWRRMVEE